MQQTRAGLHSDNTPLRTPSALAAEFRVEIGIKGVGKSVVVATSDMTHKFCRDF